MNQAEFWDHVRVGGVEDCWVWTGRWMPDGYGVLWFDGRDIRAHRVAWQLERGPIPNGMCVLHRCDNPPCVNPAHLWLGTRAENNADRDAKARHAIRPGESNGNAHLTEAAVREIRRWSSIATGRDLAKWFGTSPSHVSRILRGESWADVT